MNQFDRLRSTRISRNLRNLFVFLTAFFIVLLVILVFHWVQYSEPSQPVPILLGVIAGIVLSMFFAFHFHFRFRSRQ
jgi:protein-S-isoprenylcysteine O-methyltransferase Ste14